MQCVRCLREAVAKIMLALISEDPFRALAKRAVEAKIYLVEFATSVCRNYQIMRQSSEEWKQQLEAVVPLNDCAEKIYLFSKCILHFFCAKCPSGMEPVKDMDVLAFTSYTGDHGFMRSMKRLFTEAGSWWENESSEILRKGAGGILVAEKMSQLWSCLTDEPTWGTLRQALGLLKEVRGSARSQQVCELLEKFSASWVAARV